MRFLICAAALAACAPARAAPDAFPWPVHHRVLENGCRVVVVPMPTPGVVATAMWVSVGSRNETEPGQTGFAHFFEHLMFHGTPTLRASAREAALLELGIGDNAWTWFDETVYHAVVDARSLDRWLAIQADAFANLSLTPDGVKREAGAVYGEYRKTRSDPAFHVEQALRAAAFPTHTYGHDTLGLEADIAAMPGAFEPAQAFFARWMRPEHTTVLLAGDLQAESALGLVARHFGPWTGRGEAAPLALPPDPRPDAPRRAAVRWPGSTPPQLAIAWQIPAWSPASDDSAALALIDALLLGPTARLRSRLIREEALALDLSGGAERTVDPGLFTVHVELRPGADPARVEAVVLEEIARLTDAIDAERLAATRDHVRYATLTGLDDPAEVVELLGSRLRRGADPADPAAFDRRVAAIDVAGVQRVARAWLDPERRVVALLTAEVDDAG